MSDTAQLTAHDPGTTNAAVHAGLLGAWVASYPSPNTRASYTRDAQLFCEFLDAGGLDLLAATRAHLDVFSRARTAAGDADTTVARRLAAVSAFYTYALTVDAVAKNPAQYVGRPAVDQDHTTTAALSRREAMRLLDAAAADSPRSHALVDLLLSTGMRISEALTATEAGLFRDRLIIRRKGGKKAVVALTEHTATALYGLVGILGTDLATGREADRLIFTTRTGAPWARTNAHTTLTRLATRAGITKPMSSHVLRHTHATLALELGVPLHHLQDSLGHADPRGLTPFGRSGGCVSRPVARGSGQ